QSTSPSTKTECGIFRKFSSKASIFCIKTLKKCYFIPFCDGNCFRYFATVDALHGLICGKITKTISIEKLTKITFIRSFYTKYIVFEEKFRKISHSVFLEGLVHGFN